MSGRPAWVLGLVLLAGASQLVAEETFVTIQRVDGNRLSVLPDSGGGRGRRGGTAPAGGGFGRRRRGGTSVKPTVVNVPTRAKITTAMRERRTFEFRVGVELPGGLRNPVFREIEEPLRARIVSEQGRVTEVNVITAQTDVNQSNADGASGDAVIAVKPKRPPQKRASTKPER